MHKELKLLVNQYRENELLLNKVLVSIFIYSNDIKFKKNELIKSLLISQDSPYFPTILFATYKVDFDDLIEAFELAIPENEKVINGAVYTPNYIKNFIVEHSINKIQKPINEILAADISCGCGAFLFTFANKIKAETGKSFFQIFKENIFGLDISRSSIKRAEILLSLLALSNGEDKVKFDFNLNAANALSFDWFNKYKSIRDNKGFDLVIGNPPYVRAKNIDSDSKAMLDKWIVTKSGNPDLYIPFFEIGLQSINNNGVLGYITVNSFFKSVNARELRKYIQMNKVYH
jgi:adenine-specific DNA-methyltransferase